VFTRGPATRVIIGPTSVATPPLRSRRDSKAAVLIVTSITRSTSRQPQSVCQQRGVRRSNGQTRDNQES